MLRCFPIFIHTINQSINLYAWTQTICAWLSQSESPYIEKIFLPMMIDHHIFQSYIFYLWTAFSALISFVRRNFVNDADLGKRALAGSGGPKIGTFLDRVTATLNTKWIFRILDRVTATLNTKWIFRILDRVTATLNIVQAVS